MPELFSRMDNAKWVTPAIADVLEPGPPSPDDDELMRQRMLLIQRELAHYGTPASIVNVRSTPSHTLYIVQPEGDSQAIKGSAARIARAHPNWLIGFIPELKGDGGAVGIVLRTQQHNPLSLQRMLERSTFRQHPSRLAFPLGVTLSQRLVVRDLMSSPHLLIVGTGGGRQHLVRSLMLTLMLLNTPSELHFVIAAEDDETSRSLKNTPHTLIDPVATAADGTDALNMIHNEMKLRQQEFAAYKCDGITSYNALLRRHKGPELPRLLVLLDTLERDDWRRSRADWEPLIGDLLTDGADAGIHVIISADVIEDRLSTALIDTIPIRIVMRSVGTELHKALDKFHPSLLHFTDAFIVEPQADEKLIPIEIAATSAAEVKRASNYWRNMDRDRSGSPSADTAGIPESSLPLTRTQAEAGSQRHEMSQSSTRKMQRSTRSAARTEQKDLPVRSTGAESPGQEDDIISGGLPYIEDHSDLAAQARALAAYLGWLGVGPLHDILGVSDEKQALELIEQLKHDGVLEAINHPTPRFIAPI